jgi:hypothetical protein
LTLFSRSTSTRPGFRSARSLFDYLPHLLLQVNSDLHQTLQV